MQTNRKGKSGFSLRCAVFVSPLVKSVQRNSDRWLFHPESQREPLSKTLESADTQNSGNLKLTFSLVLVDGIFQLSKVFKTER